MLCVALVTAGTSCLDSHTSAGASPSGSTSPTPVAPSKLDDAVAMPPGFPSDVPIYPGARLTAGAAFASSGPTTWGMEWETLDSVAKVQHFYSTQLSQGDWNIQFSGATGTSFSAMFDRKSNSKYTGILGADGSSGVTKISLSLVSAP